MKKRKSPGKSYYSMMEKVLQKEYGENDKAGSGFEIQDIWDIITLKSGGAYYLSKDRKRSIKHVARRSHKAVDSVIWKLATNYPRPIVREFFDAGTLQREDRAKHAFNGFDYEVLLMMTSKAGRERNALSHVRLASMTFRKPEEWLSELFRIHHLSEDDSFFSVDESFLENVLFNKKTPQSEPSCRTYIKRLRAVVKSLLKKVKD